MLQKLEEKIQEIRRQPEPVRMRYLFLCVGISMVFVLLIWIFSLYETKTEMIKNKPDLPIIEDLGAQGKSLESLLESNTPLRPESEPKSRNESGQNFVE